MRKKFIASLLAGVLIIGVLPVGASAEWRENNIGWWYKESNSWATGWRNIDGKWYYFDSNGYMLHNTVIDGYKLGDDGAWIITPPTASTTTTTTKNTSKFGFPSLPKDNISKQYIIYEEGTRNNRIELVMFDVRYNESTTINWNGSLELEKNDLYINDKKYFLSNDRTQWIEFETGYRKISDSASNVYSSSLDVYRNGSKILIDK